MPPMLPHPSNHLYLGFRGDNDNVLFPIFCFASCPPHLTDRQVHACREPVFLPGVLYIRTAPGGRQMLQALEQKTPTIPDNHTTCTELLAPGGGQQRLPLIGWVGACLSVSGAFNLLLPPSLPAKWVSVLNSLRRFKSSMLPATPSCRTSR